MAIGSTTEMAHTLIKRFVMVCGFARVTRICKAMGSFPAAPLNLLGFVMEKHCISVK
jgi:hypothetical protein